MSVQPVEPDRFNGTRKESIAEHAVVVVLYVRPRKIPHGKNDARKV